MGVLVNFTKQLAKSKATKTIANNITKPVTAERSSPKLKALQEALDSVEDKIPRQDLQKPLNKLREYLDTTEMDDVKKLDLINRISTWASSEGLSYHPYEDIDYMLAYYEGFPSLGMTEPIRQVRRSFRNDKLIRAKQGAEHPLMYGKDGNPFDDKKEWWK